MTLRSRSIFSACLLAASLVATGVEARVNVNVNIGLPVPPFVLPAPPALILIPGSPVYFAPEVDVDLFFSGGYWWTQREGRWQRARGYNGPWHAVRPQYVPRDVVRVPRDYRAVYGHERHIPYGQWKKHWREGERRDDRWRGSAHESGRDRGDERPRHGHDQDHDRDHGGGRGHGGD